MKSFDSEAFFGAIPSFYRDKLQAKDRVVLSKLWEGVTRVLEEEYNNLFQVAANCRLNTSSVLSRQGWVYHKFDSWTTNKSRHRHVSKSFVSNYLSTPSVYVYYLGSYLDLESARMYFGGVFIPRWPELVLTNEQDPGQLQYLKDLADNPTVTPSSNQLPGTRLIFDRDYIENRLTKEFFEFLTIGARVKRFLSRNEAFTIEADGELYFSNVFDPAFRGTGSKKIFTIPSTVNPDSVVVRMNSVAKDGQSKYLNNFQIYPRPFSFSDTYLTLKTSLPVGVSVKVVDSSGSQSFTTTSEQATFKLAKQVDPETATVHLFNVDIGAITVESGSVTFNTPLAQGLQLSVSGEFFQDHDHARHTFVSRTQSSTITLPVTRPLRLKTNTLVEDPNFPIKVYINGKLLRPPSVPASATYSPQYSFLSSSTIQLAADLYVNPGDRVDIEYTDEESPVEHVHRYTSKEFDAEAFITGLEFDSPVDSSRFPLFVDRSDAGLIPSADCEVSENSLLINTGQILTDITRVSARCAIKSLRYRSVVPDRIDESENYRGTLVSAEAIQDGIDKPSVSMSGDSLSVTPSRDLGGTVIETNHRFEGAWFKNALIDDHMLSDMLGVPVRFEDGGTWTEEYRKVLIAFYSAMRSGSTVKVARDLVSIALGSEYAPVAGVSKGVDETPDGKFLVVESQGTTNRLRINPNLPLDNPGKTVPAFHPVNRSCEIIEGDALKSFTWLPFVAQRFGDYQYGKRLDAFTPVEVVLSDPRLAIDGSNYSLSFTTDVSPYAIWPTDLIEVVVTTADGDVETRYLRPYSFTSTTISSRTQVDVVPVRYGINPYGDFYGARLNGTSAVSAKLYTKTLRQRDSFSFTDIMVDEVSALAEGEAIQRASKILGEIFSKFVFAARIAWNANTDTDRVNNAVKLLDRTKPADVGVIPFTQVEDGALSDTLKGEVVSEQVSFKKIPVFSVSDNSFADHTYIGPSYDTRTNLAGLADENWWEEIPQLNFATDATFGKYISSLVLGTSSWALNPCPIWRAVIWDNIDDDFAIIDSSSITWTTTVTTVSGVTTTLLAGSTTYASRTFNVELYIEESSSDIKFWQKLWGPTGETRYTIVCGEFPRMRIRPLGNPTNMRFLETEHSGSIFHSPTATSFKYPVNQGHRTSSAPPAMGFNALYDVLLRRGLYFQYDDVNLLWKQATYKGLGDSMEIFWTHYPKNNFTPGQYTSAAKYTQPYKLLIKNLQIKGPGESAYYDACVMYRNWVESTQPFFLPPKWRANPLISDKARRERLFVVLGPSLGAASMPLPAPYYFGLRPAANFFPMLYEIMRLHQFFQDPDIRIHAYDWHNNSFDMGGTQNSFPARPKPSVPPQPTYTVYSPTALGPATSYFTDNISFTEMLNALRVYFSANPDVMPRIHPYVIPGYWTNRNTGYFQATISGPIQGTTLQTTVSWPDGTQPGGVGLETAYLFEGATTTVNPLDPANNYLQEKQLKVGGQRTLQGVPENSYFTLVPKAIEQVYNPNPATVLGVDLSRTAGRNLIVDHLTKVYNNLTATVNPSSTNPNLLIPAPIQGYYLDQFCGIGTGVDVVGSANDCYVLFIDRKNAGTGDYGNTGAYHAGKRAVTGAIKTAMMANDPDFSTSAESVEEAQLGQLDFMHAINDFQDGRGCFLFNIVYSQYQRTAHLGITIDPSNPGGSLQDTIWATNDSFHRGLPLSLNYSFSPYLADAAWGNPPLQLRHMIDQGTAPLVNGQPQLYDAQGQYLLRSDTTPTIHPWGYAISWFKQLHSSMLWLDEYRLGEPLRPMPGSVELRRIASNTQDILFYNVNLVTQMQSIWLNPVTSNIGIIITESYPGYQSVFSINIDNVGWPLWSGPKYLYKYDGVNRVLLATFTGNTVKYSARITGQAVHLYEITRTRL